tara:strand:+ start:95 stop:559 length:465 start_codon:yes stop_codon:yes gene_type:complete
VARKLLFFLLIISCTSTTDVLSESSQTIVKQTFSSEQILVEIFDAYKVFSENPSNAVDTIWNYAHEENKEITGPKERFSMMLTSQPYDSIIDLRDYSYKVTFESEENIHYEVKVLAESNNYFIITWVFEKTICDEKPCWRTIGVSQPEFFDSGI